MDTIVTPVTVITLDSTKIVHSINADLVARYFPPVVRLVQYDQSLPVIAVSLMQNGQAYTLPSGAAANIRVHKPDATYVYNPALGCDSTRKIVYFEVTQAMAAANGDGLAIVEIVVDGDIAGTSLITLHFEENPVPEDAIESSDEWETIYELGERIIASTVTPVSTAAGMTDHNVVYLYTGTESGWNQGHMYYYNGTAWVDAGIAVTDTTLSVAGLAADAKATGDEIATVKDGLDSLDEFCRKEVTVTFVNDKTVPATGMSYGNFIITCNVPSGTTYSIIINDPNNALGDGGFALYADYGDSTHESLGTKQKNTEYSFEAPKNVVAFSIYKGTTVGGTINTVVSYSESTQGSLEERIDDLEAVIPSINDKVNDSEMSHCELINDPASSNVMDMSKLVLDKKANPVYGQIMDDTTECYYQMAVTPGDTLYLWAYDVNASDPLYPYAASIKNITCAGVAAYNSTGTVIRDAGVTSYVHSYTVPNGVETIIINLLKAQYTNGYKFIITVNDPVMPKRYYPYKETSSNYYSKNKFIDRVDFNRILPISTRMPESGFIETLGHMGLSTYYPGNTALSTIGAKKAGMGGVEMDIQITADGIYVLYHDTNMVRVGGTAQQTIGNMTYQELQQFDYGAWFGNEFVGTPLCTFEEAVKICRQLNLKVYMDCKTLSSVSDFTGAYNILKKWGMENNAYWITGSFVSCWTAVPDAKIIFAAGSPLTGSGWATEDGWFENTINGDSIPASKKHQQDGHYVINDDVFFGISQNHTLGLSQVKTESELARKYNMKYGLYAVDDVEDIAEYADEIPYMQYMTSNAIAFQTAMNEHYGVNVADYLIDVI